MAIDSGPKQRTIESGGGSGHWKQAVAQNEANSARNRHSRRALRSSLVPKLETVGDSNADTGHVSLRRIDKSLITTLKNDQKDLHQDPSFNFDKRFLVNKNGNLQLITEATIKIDANIDAKEPISSYEPGEVLLDFLEAPGSQKASFKDQINGQLLSEKQKVKIRDVSEFRKFRSRARNGKGSRSRKIESVTKLEESSKDPLGDEIYSRYHKAKVKTEKSLANQDKQKFSEDVKDLNTNFEELVHLLNLDKRQCYQSYTYNILEKIMLSNDATSSENQLLSSVEYSNTSSFILTYLARFYFKTKYPKTIDYERLIELLDEFKLGTSSSGDSEEKNQYNSLKFLLQKHNGFKRSFVYELLNDKGLKEQFSYGHMRSNSSLNFKLSYFQDQNLSSKDKGKGDKIFNNFENFKKILVSDKDSVDSKDEMGNLQLQDRVLSEVDLNSQIYPLYLTIHDNAIIKCLKKMTFLSPSTIKTLDDIAAMKFGSEDQSYIEQNQKRLSKFKQILGYIANLVLMTLYESFKLLSFYKKYWNFRNEYVAFSRNKEAQRINPEFKDKVKAFKKPKHSALINKFENFEYFDFCTSDPETIEDSKMIYSDPEDTYDIDDLKEKRDTIEREKYLNHLTISQTGSYQDSEDDYGIDYDFSSNSDTLQANTRKFTFNSSENTKLVFSPRFGTRFYNTRELEKFQKPGDKKSKKSNGHSGSKNLFTAKHSTVSNSVVASHSGDGVKNETSMLDEGSRSVETDNNSTTDSQIHGENGGWNRAEGSSNIKTDEAKDEIPTTVAKSLLPEGPLRYFSPVRPTKPKRFTSFFKTRSLKRKHFETFDPTKAVHTPEAANEKLTKISARKRRSTIYNRDILTYGAQKHARFNDQTVPYMNPVSEVFAFGEPLPSVILEDAEFELPPVLLLSKDADSQSR